MKMVGRSWSCDKNVCVCENGVAVEGSDCLMNGEKMCSGCLSGFEPVYDEWYIWRSCE